MIKKLSNENGSGLVIVMMVLVVLSALGSALGMVTINSRRLAEHTQDTNSAYYIAEAGANIVYEELKQGVTVLASDTAQSGEGFIEKVDKLINSLSVGEVIEYTGETYFQEQSGEYPVATVVIDKDNEILKEENVYSKEYLIHSTGKVDGKTKVVEKPIKVNWTHKSSSLGNLFDIPNNASIVAKNKLNYIGGQIWNDIYLHSDSESSFVTNDVIWYIPDNIYSSYRLVGTNKKLFQGFGGGVQPIIDLLSARTSYTPPVEDKTIEYEKYFQSLEKSSVGDSKKDIIFKSNEEKEFQGVVRARDLVTHGVNTINVRDNHVTLVVDNIKHTDWTTLRIKGEGSLTIYVKGSANLNGTYNFDYNSDIKGNFRLIFPHKNQEIQLIGGGMMLRAQIIAPFSHINLGNNPRIFGSVLADEVTVNNHNTIVEYYEMSFESLSDVGDTSIGSKADLISTKPAAEK